jgi:hypothetical protein
MAKLQLTHFLLSLLIVTVLITPVLSIGKKLSAAQLRALEDEWMEDEAEEPGENFKWKKGPNGERTPPAPSGPKTEMAFVSLKSNDRPVTDKLGSQWADQLGSGGVTVRAYTIEDDKILFVADNLGFKDMLKVKNFVLKQAEVTEFEWNQKKYKPEDADSSNSEEFVDPLANLNIPGLKFN